MYAGVDKYGGALAGEGQPRGASSEAVAAPAPTGLSLEDAIETAAAEETVVVDVPYQYYEDEDDPTTLVTGSSQVLLAAQLNPEAGGLMWIEQEDTQDTYKNVVAMSQMTSMLRDTDRNRCYELGIQSAIELFKHTHDGRAPIVLDIGTGTGLLSMFAARHGAEHVYACEMFKPMAEIAQNVTADNFPDKISVFAMRSTDLIISSEGVEGHLPRRADMLVSELFDSILLGEAVIPTIRHAMEHLLVPNAVIVPERATVFAHVVENESIYRMSSFKDFYLNEEKHIRLARNDAAWECTGGKPALPLHIDALAGDSIDLTASTPVLSFDFTTLPSGVTPLGVKTTEITVPVVKAGQAQAVLMWWEVSFDKDNKIIYSTKPRVQNWQDHWVQVVYPLANAESVQESDSLVLRAHHDDLRIWFDVSKSDSKSSLPMKRRIDEDDEKSGSSAVAEKEPCVCGLHLLCNAERISMLTDKHRTHAFDAAMQKTIKALSAQRGCEPKDLACLDVSDGSLGALLAAEHGVENVTSIESKDVSARIFQQVCDGNVPDAVEVMCCGCKGLFPEHLKGEKPVDLLVSEAFYYSMQNLPLWQALNFWLRRTALSSVMAPNAVVLPSRARVLALPVVFEHLHECFGAVGGEVAGFDHSYFDQFQSSYYTRNFPFPAYMYPYTPVVSEPIELTTWAYLDTAHSLNSELTVPLTSNEAPSTKPNAVIVWVEYALDSEGEHIATTGPAVRYAKQLIRFLPPADAADDTSTTSLRAWFNFSALEGTVDLGFELA